MKKVLIAYVPVLHSGYLKFFLDNVKNGIDTLYVVGEDVLAGLRDVDYIKRKDSLRALSSSQIMNCIDSLNIFRDVFVLNRHLLNILKFNDVSVVMPDEDVSRSIAADCLNGNNVDFQPIFLRWHRNNVLEQKKVQAHSSISVSAFEKEMMRSAFIEGAKSFDWWRQVGAIAVKGNVPILIANNDHTPDKQMPYVFGDPRSIFKRGINIELSTAEHAEAVLIAEAARRGLPLDGAHLFVTDFPCPQCAKLIAHSGISKCYFSRGYSVLDGESSLKTAGVDLVFINVKK